MKNSMVTSDHRVIISTIQLEGCITGSNSPGKFKLEKLDEENFLSVLNAEKDLIRLSLELAQETLFGTEERRLALNSCADKITSAIYSALEISTPRCQNMGRGEPWWDDQCRKIVNELRQIRRQKNLDLSANIQNPRAKDILATCKATLRKTVRKAKQSYYRKVIEELDNKNIFQAMKWPTSIRQYSSPPIQKPDGTLAISVSEKRATLRNVLLTPSTENRDSATAAPDLYMELRDNPIEWTRCSLQEVKSAVFHAGNTSPGPDNIPSSVIKRAWPIYSVEITGFFQVCLEEGHHPLAFKNATLCALPKPGKRPRSLPRSYRLIALLSCFGKILERIVAKRLGNIALTHRLISSLHFGAISGRSSVDAASTLTHDVEKAFEKNQVLTALAFDIKGAFDRVTAKRLVKRLYDQNIPLEHIRWVASFLHSRSAAIRLDGYIGEAKPVQIGVPQGSPAAPILFMLFTAPLFKIF